MIGKILGNRYLIEEKVGVGGMAKVYRAKDTLLNRDVAVKVLKDEYMDDEDFLKKFAMEAQSAASLTHANIVSVYDVGSSEVDGKRHNYIVMELVVGKTLKEIIQEKGPLSPEEIVNYGIQIAKALECAHNNKVIHRDIKPHNILIDKDNNLKVTDFGIARISSAATITYTSSVLGTVHYISPEQAKGKFIDEKSDIYSLGIVLYEMATGRVPFDADNAVGIALKHLQDPLVAPKTLVPNLPDGLNNIIIKALEKDPKDRFQSAKEIKSALQNYSEFILPYEDDALSGKTVRMNPVYGDENIQTSNDNIVDEAPEEEEAVYEMRKDKPEKKKKKKKSKFKTIVLPILMALAVIVLGIFGTKALKGEKKELEKVPAVKDVTEDRAIKILENSGFIAEVVKRQESSDIKAGNVISQDPEAGSTLEKGEKVSLIISSGIKEIEVPDLDKMSLDEAENKLK
ncbi:MAG: Stk1 family PASTA domain-containing Ser/Thr kinase [Tissierellia bacterium]|nr:Stk1 family PASTA domain-containing Ser/Thr kinase [Tissierellia bacterium]